MFFDDGYASYISHPDIRLVTHQSQEVWADLHPNSSDFIKTYLMNYPERPMVKLMPSQTVRTEWDGKWWVTKVQEVDASLVRLTFVADSRCEWVYRGSTRLGPLYIELQNQKQRRQKQQQPGQAAGSRPSSGGAGGSAAGLARNNVNVFRRGAGVGGGRVPFVEYTRQDGADPGTAGGAAPGSMPGLGPAASGVKQATARKSTQPQQATRQQQYTNEDLRPKRECRGEVKRLEPERPTAIIYGNHICSPDCIRENKFK